MANASWPTTWAMPLFGNDLSFAGSLHAKITGSASTENRLET
jgi:hypothetical protein